MEPLELVVYPDPLLKKVLAPVTDFGKSLEFRLGEMFRLMYANKGIGLAGNQAGLDQRIIIMNLAGDPEKKDEELILINPEILQTSPTMIADEEGCLSFPALKVEVSRHESLTFSAYDETGSKLVYEASDLFARCLQHEMDHINGVTFVERLTPAQRALIAPDLQEFETAFALRTT